MNVVETFSGIGSQAKALKNKKIKHKVVATVEWDISAIYAYDIIHNGKQDHSNSPKKTKSDLLEELSKYTLSGDGKNKLEYSSLSRLSEDTLKNISYAIKRTNNYVSITDVKAINLPKDIDLLTYSFPCQDLSICGAWHGNMTGIDRNANNRSGMLWEVERILKEYVENKIDLPKFLLMENVSNILSATHRSNFKEWQDYLASIGYYNKVYTLNANNFGIPQSRNRTYMISILLNNTTSVKEKLDEYFEKNNLEDLRLKMNNLSNYLRVDYTNTTYKQEADISNPNDTPSRQKIQEENQILWDNGPTDVECIKTITTKQDRNPNSGLLMYDSNKSGKSKYRNLTPRECFLLMGFDEDDFKALMKNNYNVRKNTKFFAREKLVRLAGNSIVVPVLEHIFEQIEYIQKNIVKKQ